MHQTFKPAGEPAQGGTADSSNPLLVVTTGSSASILFPMYMVKLKRLLGCPVRVLMTKSAERFVSPEVVGWFADEVITSDQAGVNPVELAMRNRGVVVLPCTANMLASAALGLASTPASTVVLAAPTGCLFFPQMNPAIWDKPIVKRHVASLREQGHIVVEPEIREIYEIWCGKIQSGYSIPAPDQVAEVVRDWLQPASEPDEEHNLNACA